MAEERWQAKLHQTLTDNLDEGAVRILCFDLGIEYDRLNGATKSEKLDALIGFCVRRQIVNQLLGTLRVEQPEIANKLPRMPTADRGRRAKVEFHIKSDIISFGNQDRERLLQTLSEQFNIEMDDVHLLTESLDGRQVCLLLGMPWQDALKLGISQKDMLWLTQPEKLGPGFEKLAKENKVTLIRRRKDRLGHWERLSAWKSHRLRGAVRLAFYLSVVLIFLLYGAAFASFLLPPGDSWLNYIIRLPSRESWRFYTVAVLAALPGLIAWIGLLTILTKFMQIIYSPGDWIDTFEYLFLSMFGPLFARYPFVFVQEGQVTDRCKKMPQGSPDGPGGPGLFIVFNDSAIVTERGGRRMAVVGPSVCEARRFEKIHQTFDLRPQTRSTPVVCITRDGIPVKTTAGATFRIRWKGEPTANLPHPADPDALLQAAAGQAVFAPVGGIKEVRNWADRVGSNLDVELRTIIARYRLDELLEVRDPGLRPRSDLLREYAAALRNMAKNFGAEIIEVRLDPFEFGGDVPFASVRSLRELRLDVWRAPWEGQVRVRAAQAEAGAIQMKEMAQSYAQLELISAITHEFKSTADESIPLDLIILRFVEVISRMAANPDAAIFLPREALQTLEGVQRLLQERKTPSGAQASASPEGE